MNAKIITTPKGERLAILPAEEYEDMVDSLIHAEAMAEYRSGKDEGISLEEMQVLLDAPTPLAFWRSKRGLSESELAQSSGIAVADIQAIESAQRTGLAEEMTRIATALKVGVGELS